MDEFCTRLSALLAEARQAGLDSGEVIAELEFQLAGLADESAQE
jgi:hypothetical protein